MADRPFNLGIDPLDAEARLRSLMQSTQFARGGSVPGYAEGGLMERLRNLLKGDDYQSTGQKTVRDGEVNWGDPDSAADFFRADKARMALDKARNSVANIERASAAPRAPAVVADRAEAAPAPDRGDPLRMIPGAQPILRSDRFEPFPGAKPTPYGALIRGAQGRAMQVPAAQPPASRGALGAIAQAAQEQQPEKPTPYSRWPIANDRYRDVNDWTPAEVLGLMRAKRSMGETVTGYAHGGSVPGYKAGGLREGIARMSPEAQGALSPNWEGIGEGLSAVGQGISDLYSTPEADLSAYTKAPDRSVRRDITPVTLGEELNSRDYGAGSPSWEDVGTIAHGIAEDPLSAIGSALPVVGNMLAAADVSKLKDKIAELRASGDNERADLFQRYLPLAAAGVVMPAGGGLVARGALKSAEKAAAKAAERGASHALESAIEREAGHIPLELGDLKYATSQEGPYYRVTHEAHPRYGSVSEGVREEARAIETADAGRGGGDAYQPPQLPSYEDVADIVKDVDKNVAHQTAKAHLGRELVRPEMPESSLQKQSAIGRTFALAAEDSPAYKRAIFNAYKKQMPDIVAHSGAKNYDELLAASYKQMAKETAAQFDALPFEYSFHRNGEGNYANSKEMLADLHGNKHLRVFQGGDPHDFLHNIDPRTGLNENEKFRAVHDAFGHGVFGNPFGPAGEELAWGTHGQMYSPLDLPAMTAETRGQNSFVNYTPVNAKLKEQVAKIESKISSAKQYGWKNDIPELEAQRAKLYEGFEYAPQKSVLLPPEFLSPDYAGGMPEYVQKLIKPKKGTTMSSPLTHFSNEYGIEKLDPAKYGTGIAGDESARLMKESGEAKPGAVRDRSYFYLGEPSSVNPEEGLGHHIYTSSSKNLYDASKDPLNLNTLSKEANRRSHLSNFNPGTVNNEKALNDFERLVKEHGYEGIANPNAAFPMAAVFSPKDVSWAGSTKQTVKNPVRYSYGDVYNNPRLLAAEAESRVAPEDPLLKRLFGMSRDDLYQIAKDRKGNMEPTIQTIEGAKVPPTVENIMTDRNKQRLLDAMSEFQKQPGLRTGMVPWYVHDPVYQRLVELVGPEEANQRFKRLNVMTGMMSPGSPVQTELNRGLGAHYLNEQNRIEDFYKYGGQGQGGKSPRGKDFPKDLETLLSHPYHSTSHATPLRKYIEAGYPDIPGMESPKVPLYMQASGVPETGFQTKGAIPDAHWTRGMGLPDTRTSKGFNQSMNMREYQHVGPWFREHVAEPLGMEAVPAQALMWGGFSGATGVDTLIGAPKIELLAKHIGQVAKRLKVSPETARDLVLTGKAFSHGGTVKNYAQGGSVRGYATGGPADDSIEALYNKYAGRASDPEGKAWWQQQAANMTPEQLQTEFIKGANQEYAANAAHAGPINDAQIQGMYEKYLGRQADEGGLKYWEEQAKQPGATYADLSKQFQAGAAPEMAQMHTVKPPAWLEKFDYENFDNPLDAGFDYLKRTLGDKAAAALYGNFNTESYGNPQQLQTAGGPNGRPLFDRFTNMPLGMGLAQWSPERQNNLYKFADKYGMDPNSTEGQLRFAVNELTTNPDYSKWLNRLQQPNVNVAGATQILGKRYEAPARLQQTIAERKAAADLFSRYMNKGELTPEEQARIASIKGGVKDPMFAAKLAERQAPTQVAVKPATNSQLPGSADILGDTGFNAVVDTSVNDRIMQDANNWQNQQLQNSLNYNFSDPNAVFNNYMPLPSTSFSSSGVPGGFGATDNSGFTLYSSPELPSWYTPSYESPYAEGGRVMGYAEGGSFRPMFEGDSEMLQARAKQLAKQAYSDPRSLSSEDMKEWNLLAGRYNLPFSAQNPMSYEDEMEQRNTALERNLSAKERRRTYARGGAVDAYDPAEIDAIAAQIRGAA